MFIHWGPVSLKGTEIGWSRGDGVPIEEYDNLYKQFNPSKFNADEWVKIAKDAGAKYIILTTKHHDGFCLFDTKQTDYSIMNTPFGRDVVKELAEACRRHGIAFGTYHSVCDWHHPDFPLDSPGGRVPRATSNLDRYEQYLKKQVEELIRQYGPLLTIWFDVAQCFDEERGAQVVDFVRSLQPDILVNTRCGNVGDYGTPEQQIGNFGDALPWESCITIGTQWSWRPDDQMKSLTQCLHTLIRCAGGDGNLLFNVGPMPTGEIEPRQAARLREMGKWLGKYGESIYGTRGGPLSPGTWGCTTRKDDVIYVHVLNWTGESISLQAVNKKILSSSVLTGGIAEVGQTEDGVKIRVPAADRQEIDTIIALKLDGPAAEVEDAAFSTPSLTVGKQARASNVYRDDASFGPDKAVDDRDDTRWATDEGTHQAWLEVDLGQPETFASAELLEAYAPRVLAFELQAWQDGSWKTFHTGTAIGDLWQEEFPPVTAQRVRLNILESTGGPTVWEFHLFKSR
jgi:alpha-L-fucosidase